MLSRISVRLAKCPDMAQVPRAMKPYGMAVPPMKKFLLITAAFLALAAPAVARDQEPQMDPRLHRVGSWLVAQVPDPITDQPHIIAILSQQDVLFRVDCIRGTPILNVEMRDKYQPGDRVGIVLRVDSLAPLISEWNPEIGTGRAWNGVSRSTYESILKAKKVAIEVILKGRAGVISQFNADRTEDALLPMTKACPVESAKESRGAKSYDPNTPVFSGDFPQLPPRQQPKDQADGEKNK
jgi:hypothetical protein